MLLLALIRAATFLPFARVTIKVLLNKPSFFSMDTTGELQTEATT